MSKYATNSDVARTGIAVILLIVAVMAGTGVRVYYVSKQQLVEFKEGMKAIQSGSVPRQ